jgi:nucleolar pre-ribosomal-associated protein 2
MHTTADMLRTSPSLVKCLDRVASLKDLERIQTNQLLPLYVDNAQLVVEQQPHMINQDTIDRLLDNISMLLNSSQPYSTDSHPSVIFDGVCSLLGSLFDRFRRRLADRHHLLLPILQGLLRCLFFPGKLAVQARRGTDSSQSTVFFDSMPSWLGNAEQGLKPNSASKLSRILSTICNPTVSAAKSAHKRSHNELNDETKRVKALAGQHMQYLIMEYCRCSLDGEIETEVKDKLTAGLYSVMDAMSRDVMRGMNAAMNPSNRAIFKVLYDDWTRYGKWDKT